MNGKMHVEPGGVKTIINGEIIIGTIPGTFNEMNMHQIVIWNIYLYKMCVC